MKIVLAPDITTQTDLGSVGAPQHHWKHGIISRVINLLWGYFGLSHQYILEVGEGYIKSGQAVLKVAFLLKHFLLLHTHFYTLPVSKNDEDEDNDDHVVLLMKGSRRLS